MEKYKIGIWGQFGDGGQIADGQAVRTTIITNELKKRYGPENIKIVNTNNWSKKPFLFLINSIGLVIESKKVIILPADNGFKVIVPLVSLLNLIFKRELYYVVIGGFLPKLLKKNPVFIKLLDRFKAIFVQTPNLLKDLQEMGLKNIYILSNLKNIETRDLSELVVNYSRKVKVCTLSRVTYSKGIEDAIYGVRKANEKLGGDLIKLDIYGMIDSKYNDRFYSLLNSNKDIIEYKGVIDYDETVQYLKKYFALLFPTFFHGEGFPGNFIDSFYSGLPIIATDWLYNSDVIKNGYNGILVSINNPEAISDALVTLYNDRELANQIALNNLNESKRYEPNKVLNEFFEFLDDL